MNGGVLTWVRISETKTDIEELLVKHEPGALLTPPRATALW